MNQIRCGRSWRTTTVDAVAMIAGALAGATMGLVLLVGIAVGSVIDHPPSADRSD